MSHAPSPRLGEQDTFVCFQNDHPKSIYQGNRNILNMCSPKRIDKVQKNLFPLLLVLLSVYVNLSKIALIVPPFLLGASAKERLFSQSHKKYLEKVTKINTYLRIINHHTLTHI